MKINEQEILGMLGPNGVEKSLFSILLLVWKILILKSFNNGKDCTNFQIWRQQSLELDMCHNMEVLFKI